MKSFAEAEHLAELWNDPKGFADKLLPFLEQEYDAIPEKERIGKGRVYISRAAVDGLWLYLKSTVPSGTNLKTESFLLFAQRIYSHALERKENFLRYLAVYLLAEAIKKDTSAFFTCEKQVLEWAGSEDWEMREIVLEFIVNAIKYYPDAVLPRVRELASSKNPNLRRLAAEGIRPRGTTKWLRDPEQNDIVLQILEQLRFDSSEYVRKSVSNNLKDLTKYMPTKILDLLANWVHEAGITVTPDLASKTKTELGGSNFALIYIVKKALRWLKERNPEVYPQIERIIGRNYIKYFDEKRNLGAKEK